MGLFRSKVQVFANQKGYLYKKSVFQRELDPSIYKFHLKTHQVFQLPMNKSTILVTNQEVLTQDNIALRFSFFLTYKIIDGQKVLEQVDLSQAQVKGQIEALLQMQCQIALREVISKILSEELNEQREDIMQKAKPLVQEAATAFGLEITELSLRDITYPKNIQELFAKKLEAKIRAQVDLENARTQVATARALKNASAIMSNDENIKFMQWLDAITRIAAKGKHVFHVGPEVKE